MKEIILAGGSTLDEWYSLDGEKPNLSDKEQKWLGIQDTFKI